MIILFRRVGVQRNDVGLRVELLKGNIGGVLADGCIFIRVIAENAAAEAGKVLDDGPADPAGSDDAYRREADVIADLAAKGVILKIGAAEDAHDPTLQHQHQHDGVVGHAGGRIADVGDAQAKRLRLVEIHMVVADGAAEDPADADRRKALEHRASHVAGRHADAVRAGGKLIILRVRIGGRVVKIDAEFFAERLRAGELVKVTKSVEKQLHCGVLLSEKLLRPV